MPIFGAAGEEGAEDEFIAEGFIDVDARQVALAGGGDIETEPEIRSIREWSVRVVK